jgi:hypothetical protein
VLFGFTNDAFDGLAFLCPARGSIEEFGPLAILTMVASALRICFFRAVDVFAGGDEKVFDGFDGHRVSLALRPVNPAGPVKFLVG